MAAAVVAALLQSLLHQVIRQPEAAVEVAELSNGHIKGLALFSDGTGSNQNLCHPFLNVVAPSQKANNRNKQRCTNDRPDDRKACVADSKRE